MITTLDHNLVFLTEENTSQKLNDKVPSMPKLRQLH